MRSRGRRGTIGDRFLAALDNRRGRRRRFVTFEPGGKESEHDRQLREGPLRSREEREREEKSGRKRREEGFFGFVDREHSKVFFFSNYRVVSGAGTRIGELAYLNPRFLEQTLSTSMYASRSGKSRSKS